MAKEVLYNSDDDIDGFNFENIRIELTGKIIPNNMIVIASLGLWNGRKTGFKIIKNNLMDIFGVAQGDYYKVWYDSETDDLNAEDIHHDGTNYYTFREIKNEDTIDELKYKILKGECTQNDIDKYTQPIGKYIRKIYGFKNERVQK